MLQCDGDKKSKEYVRKHSTKAPQSCTLPQKRDSHPLAKNHYNASLRERNIKLLLSGKGRLSACALRIEGSSSPPGATMFQCEVFLKSLLRHISLPLTISSTAELLRRPLRFTLPLVAVTMSANSARSLRDRPAHTAWRAQGILFSSAQVVVCAMCFSILSSRVSSS